MYLFLQYYPNTSYDVTGHQAKFLSKMLHHWPCNLRVARTFKGQPIKEARFTRCT